MSLSTTAALTLEEVRALYSTVRAGRRYIQDNPNPDEEIQTLLTAQGLLADRCVSAALTQLAEELYSRDPNDPDRLAAGLPDDLSDAVMPSPIQMIMLLCEQETKNVYVS